MRITNVRWVFRNLLVGAVVFLAPSVPTHANTIAAYGMFGQPGDQATSPASEWAANVAPVDMVRGGGLAPSVGNNSLNSNGWASNDPGTTTVVNPDAYVEIGFDVAPGYSVQLDQLIIGSRSSGSGPARMGVFSSLDGFTDPVFVIFQTAGWPNSAASGFVNRTINLSALGTVSGSFRLRFRNVAGADTADVSRPGEMDAESTWRIADHLGGGNFTPTRITGAVIPEPGSFVAALVGMAFLVAFRPR